MSHPPSYWEQSRPSVYPAGVNSIETRLRASEIHLSYMASHLEELAHRLEEADHRHQERYEGMERRLWKASWQIIAALGSAVLGLVVALAKLLLHL